MGGQKLYTIYSKVRQNRDSKTTDYGLKMARAKYPFLRNCQQIQRTVVLDCIIVYNFLAVAVFSHPARSQASDKQFDPNVLIHVYEVPD